MLKLRHAVAGLLAGIVGSVVLGVVWLAAARTEGLGLLVATFVGLWLGLVGVPIWLSRRYGTGSLVADFGLRVSSRDALLGLVLGPAVQLLLVPLIYLPFIELLDDQDLSRPARELAEEAGAGAGFAVLAVLVVLAAPIVEELFFRGVVQGALRRRLGSRWAVVLSALAFAISHLQPLQFPALFVLGIVLGMLVIRRHNLGAAVATHACFNLVAMVVLGTQLAIRPQWL